MNARVVNDMLADDYHADHSAVSKSMMKVFLDDRMEYWRRFVAVPRQSSQVEQRHLRTGRLTHIAVLEPERWAAEYMQIPAWATTKKLVAAAAAENPGKTLVSKDEYRRINRIADKVFAALPQLKHAKGIVEATIYWEEFGMAMKCRVDKMIETPECILVPDLKTTHVTTMSMWWGIAKKFHIPLQQVHYTRGITAAFKKPVRFLFIVTNTDTGSVNDTAGALGVQPLELNLSQVKAAEDTWNSTVEQLVGCYRSGDWSNCAPSYLSAMDAMSAF